MLEASDMNDGAILTATRQQAAPNGSVKFAITLPSGRELTSEWFPSEKVKEAMHVWLSEVRNQAANDSAAAQQAMKDAIRAKAAARSGVSPDEPSPVPRGKTPIEDPLALARQQIEVLTGEVNHWTATYELALANLQTAKKTRDRWAKIAKALDETLED